MTSKELALIPSEDYAVMQTDQEMMLELFAMNLGGENLTQFDLPRLKVPTGGITKWAVKNPDGSEELVDSVEGIILYHSQNRSYWKTQFGEGGVAGPPDCSSPDAMRGFGNPGVDTPLYVYPPDYEGPQPTAYDCYECPLAKFGSGRNNSQACRYTRPVFLLRPEHTLPSLLFIPPASTAVAKDYFMELFNQQLPFFGCVTRFGLEKVKPKSGPEYAKITMQLAGRLDDGARSFMSRYGRQIRQTFGNQVLQSVDVNQSASTTESTDEDEVPF